MSATTDAPARPEIVNPDPRFAAVPLPAPPTTGYIHLGAVVSGTLGRSPFPRPGANRDALLRRLADLAAALGAEPTITRATVYRAALVPPAPAGAERGLGDAGRYDIAVLVETDSVATIAGALAAPPFAELEATLRGVARRVDRTTARCVRFIGDVDSRRDGLFLFNHFVAADRDVALTVWEHLAGWYRVATGLDNSTLLAADDGPFTLINHARWDLSVPALAARQFGRPSFRSYVLANMRANGITAVPVLYHLA